VNLFFVILTQRHFPRQSLLVKPKWCISHQTIHGTNQGNWEWLLAVDLPRETLLHALAQRRSPLQRAMVIMTCEKFCQEGQKPCAALPLHLTWWGTDHAFALEMHQKPCAPSPLHLSCRAGPAFALEMRQKPCAPSPLHLSCGAYPAFALEALQSDTVDSLT
jgi:hypothetical protein